MAKKEAKANNKENAKNKKSFWKSFKAELKKVTWPTPKQLANNTSAVIAIVVLTAIIVFALNITFEAMNKHGVDKVKEAHLTKEKAQYVKAPLIKESPVNIECKVVDVKECGSHDMFIANVLAVHADKEYMDKDGRFQLEKANPIVYSHGHYYSLGQNLGRFGYSVMKKKRKKSANKKKRLENKR